MPHLNEIDDKMQHANQIQDSLGRIRDVLHAQQVALAERSKEQLQKVAHGYISEDGESQQDDGKGSGFTGNDPKKPRRAVSKSVHHNLLTQYLTKYKASRSTWSLSQL